MKRLRSYTVKINNQLIATTLSTVVIILLIFGGILPISTTYFMKQQIYKMLEVEQEKVIAFPEWMGEHYNGMYHYEIEKGNSIYPIKTQEEIEHHLMMYPEFFEMISSYVKTMESEKSITNSYKVYDQVIYYTVTKHKDEKAIVTDNTSEMMAHELLMNTLIFGVIIFFLMLIVFLKWTGRLINNLKEIQDILDTIEADNLEEDILTDRYTIEIQEVMCSLDRMRKRLAKEDKIKQQLLHNMSHDFKTPLAVIKNYAEGITDGVYPYGTLEETARIIYKQADRLEQKVKGLLYLNRLDYISRKKEDLQSFDMGKLVKEVVNYMQDYDEPYLIKVTGDSVFFYGDLERWRVVIENLIDNGKRYAVEVLSIEVEEGRLTFYNDGESIDKEQQTTIFYPFEKGKNGITGLGLAIVKKTVDLYGYTIRVENREPKGVAFIIEEIT